MEKQEFTNAKSGYDELHQHLVNLFDVMTTTNEVKQKSIFRADILLAALRSDAYLFQREVRD